MCAIGGIWRRQVGSESLTSQLGRMLDVQHHRGPDARGSWVSPRQDVGLCHCRLSIIDLSAAGDQPMESHDGRFVVVFNGEIYNYRELRRDLQSSGLAFRTGSDTEVLMEAYRHWGDGMLLRLRGMFAFALYDCRDDVMLCARDRVGKKPFVYAEAADGFVFASEIPAVRQVAGVDTAYDHAAVASMLLHNLRHVPDPHTAYRGIKRLRAGHALSVRRGRIERAWRYWTPTPAQQPINAAELRAALEEAVALRMRADVPVGALLSGGVDSTAIVALMARHAPHPVRTYAFGFDADDEDLRRARVAAHRIGTDHREFFFEPEEQWDIFLQLMRVYGEPIMLLPLVHGFTLCRAIRADGVKVVLTGNGADELFYGYTGHVRTWQVSKALDAALPFAPFLRLLLPDRLAWVGTQPGRRKAQYYRTLAAPVWHDLLADEAVVGLHNRAAEELEFWGNLTPSRHYIDESNFAALMVENSHSVTIAGDLPAMATAVEIRSPFLDDGMIDFALATPASMKIAGGAHGTTLKAILRDAVRDLIPAELLHAPKRGFGFGVQEAELLRGRWRGYAAERLENPRTAGGLLDADKVRRAWQGFLSGRVPAATVAKLLAIQVWLEQEGQAA